MKYLTLISLAFTSFAFAAVQREAIIKSGRVVNVVVIDTAVPWTTPSGAVALPLDNSAKVDIGSTCSKCDGTDFIAPPRPSPRPR